VGCANGLAADNGAWQFSGRDIHSMNTYRLFLVAFFLSYTWFLERTRGLLPPKIGGLLIIRSSMLPE
jgi:hypothetical protein